MESLKQIKSTLFDIRKFSPTILKSKGKAPIAYGPLKLKETSMQRKGFAPASLKSKSSVDYNRISLNNLSRLMLKNKS